VSHPSPALDAVSELYRASYARLVGTVALAAGSRAEAEECVQEAFIRLLSHWPRVSAYEAPEAWVRTVAVRLLSNRRRKARNALRALVRQGPPRAAPAPEGDRVDIVRALRRLPLPQRQVVVLHHLAGLSVDEVAGALGVAAGTVKSRLSRARGALAPLLSEETTHA
jgi:RNA polymerase sigma-70 factor (ECF subfamily)